MSTGDSDSYSRFAKVSEAAKASLGIIVIINWLLAWPLLVMSPPLHTDELMYSERDIIFLGFCHLSGLRVCIH